MEYSNGDGLGTASFSVEEQGTGTLPGFITESDSGDTLTLDFDLTDCTDAGTYIIEIDVEDTDTGATQNCVFNLVVTNKNSVPDLASAPSD